MVRRRTPRTPATDADPRKRGRPRSKARAERRSRTRERQASRGVMVDDLDHGDAEVPVHLLAKGRVIERHIQCGKKGCPCMTGGKRHGPYYYLVMTTPPSVRKRGGPRQKWFYLTKEEAERFRARIRNFNVLVDNMFGDLWEELGTE